MSRTCTNDTNRAEIREDRLCRGERGTRTLDVRPAPQNNRDRPHEPLSRDTCPADNPPDAARVIDSGDENRVAIDVQGQTKDVRIVGNELRETRMPMNRTGIRIAAEAGAIDLARNRIEGFAREVDDQRVGT